MAPSFIITARPGDFSIITPGAFSVDIHSLFSARGNHIALRVEASPMEHALATTDPAELAERDQEE